MSHKYSTLFKWINVLGDYFLLNSFLYIMIMISNAESDLFLEHEQRLTILLLNLSWFYCSSIFKIYDGLLQNNAVPTLMVSIASLGLFALFAVNIKVLLPSLSISLGFLSLLLVSFSTAIIGWRMLFLFIRKYRRKFSLNSNRVVIVGAGPVGREFYNYIIENPQLGYDVLGFFDDHWSEERNEYNYLGRVDECINFASRNKIQEIFCTLSNKESSKIDTLMDDADKHIIRFRIVPDIKSASNKSFLVEQFGYRPILIPRLEPLDNKANEILKRIFDILFSFFVILFILSWLTPLLAIIIKLDSDGPVFFKQLRSGRDNTPFYCFKFRSMAPNSDCDSLQACKGDMRVTAVGRFIRKTSIDELPQFFNVLMGDMSVVGPRPHMLKHTEDYSVLINNYMVRHFITPGITGWAQVNGFRGETRETTAMLNRVKADLWYLEHWTIFLDLKIVLLTIWQILKNNEKAY